MMYNIAICDDCEADCLRLKGILSTNASSDQFRIHTYKDAESLLNDMKGIRFPLIFLDIQMSGMCGKAAAEEIRKFDEFSILVFYTGFEEPSSSTFNVRPFHYIKKEMDDESISSIVVQCINQMFYVSRIPDLLAQVGRDILVLKADDIVFIEKSKKGSVVHLASYAYSIYKLDKNNIIYAKEKLNDIYKALKPYGFGYPHGSYIINFKYLAHFSSTSFNLKWEEKSFNIARSKAVEFNQQRDIFYTKVKDE